ncbi:hypothetical protein HYW94_00125 [Candidatus Uhrbacteria bacterium]|nr:hypothetical protein [Candidatus Uhrbacteria bacterium]
MPELSSEFGIASLEETKKKLPHDIQALVPSDMMSYYNQTNDMHCAPGEGGSKFTDAKVENIFDVLQKVPNLGERVAQRTDDREALKAAGAPDSAFLPSTKTPEHPEGLPEALYYKVDGIEGRLGVIQLKDIPLDAQILIRREKGKSDPSDRKTYTPASFTYVNGTVYDMPRTDFATVIVGREEGKDSVWTIHPGAPVRPILKEVGDWSGKLKSAEETPEGEKQLVKVMTLEELMKEAGLGLEDYIKITPGKLDVILQKYQVME